MARPRTRPTIFVCGHCRQDFVKLHYGAHTPLFCGGRCRNLARNLHPPRGHVDRHGYRVMPRVRGQPQIYEHRAVMERMLGRPLTLTETVHHKNGIRSDNRPENLELWASRHGRGQRVTDLIPAWKLGAIFLEAGLRRTGELKVSH